MELSTAWLITIAVIIGIYFTMGTVTFVVYAYDKRKSENSEYRVSELILHSLELAFGWFGALLAQHVVHHKNKKIPYQIVFWIIGSLHLVFWYFCLKRFVYLIAGQSYAYLEK